MSLSTIRKSRSAPSPSAFDASPHLALSRVVVCQRVGTSPISARAGQMLPATAWERQIARFSTVDMLTVSSA